MRGIPRIAAHMGSSILGTEKTAADIANAYSICPWNPDMYGVDVSKPEAQLYYDSLIKLYADWGVDFIKCDDICNYESQSAQLEIQMIYNAIQKYGRPIVLSLSPGPARIEKAWIYEKYANMWRITDDLWDKWEDILQMFDRCELWQNHVSEGCYPDCDMIPFGMIGKGFNDERKTHLTYNEQITLMTLWCIFRSPLMIGADLPQLDEETLKLFTNRHVLKLHRDGRDARQVRKNINEIIWVAKSKCKDVLYVAVFNLQDNDAEVSVTQDEMNQYMNRDVRLLNANITELWQDKTYPRLADRIPGHGARLYQVEIIR